MCANSQRWSKGEAYVSVWSKHFGASVKIMLVKTTVLFTHKKTTNKQTVKSCWWELQCFLHINKKKNIKSCWQGKKKKSAFTTSKTKQKSQKEVNEECKVTIKFSCGIKGEQEIKSARQSEIKRALSLLHPQQERHRERQKKERDRQTGEREREFTFKTISSEQNLLYFSAVTYSYSLPLPPPPTLRFHPRVLEWCLKWN